MDNWVGRFTAEYQPEAETGLCDGQWHSVTAHKLHHRLEIIVDGRKEEAESPNTRSNTADIWDRYMIRQHSPSISPLGRVQ